MAPLEPLEAAKAASIACFSSTWYIAAAAYIKQDLHDFLDRMACMWSVHCGTWGMLHFFLLVTSRGIDKRSSWVASLESLWYYGALGLEIMFLNLRCAGGRSAHRVCMWENLHWGKSMQHVLHGGLAWRFPPAATDHCMLFLPLHTGPSHRP